MKIIRYFKQYGLCCAAVAFVLAQGLFFATDTLAAVSVTVGIDAQTSTPGNVTPDKTSGAGTSAFYLYTVNDGGSVVDSIPVEICPASQTGAWSSFKVHFGSPAGNLTGVFVPGDVSFSFVDVSTLPGCQTATINLNTGALNLTDPNVAQNFNANINLSLADESPSTGPNRLKVSLDGSRELHIRVAVMPATSNVSCFLTDSEGLFLTDCAGLLVSDSGSDDGRFRIVANKKLIEVATNPGQFYFNFVWRNTTGSARTVSVSFDRTNDAGEESVLPKGAQALHAAVFNGFLETITTGDFDETNTGGIPEGTDDVVSGITVPANSSLLVTYHLDWAGLGYPVPSGCAGTCEGANQQIKVMGTVTGTDVTTESCTAEAFGYKK